MATDAVDRDDFSEYPLDHPLYDTSNCKAFGFFKDTVVNDVLELTDLTYKATAEVNSLSRGMQQRLSIARVLLHDPKLLLLDEPASGLDPRARIEIRELLKELKRMGKTIVISSHILHELSELCNVIGIIERGQLLFNGTVDEILRRARVGQVLHIGVTERTRDAAILIKKLPGVEKISIGRGENGSGHNGELINVSFDESKGHSASDIPNLLVNHGFRLTLFTEEAVNLETAFIAPDEGPRSVDLPQAQELESLGFRCGSWDPPCSRKGARSGPGLRCHRSRPTRYPCHRDTGVRSRP